MDDKVKSDIIRNLSANINAKDDNEFQKRAKVAELLLKEKDIDSNEKIVIEQMRMKQQNNA